VQEPENPFAAWKRSEGIDYAEMARRLGISLSYAKKLGSDQVPGLSPAMAERFERRTDGALDFESMMRWAARGHRLRDLDGPGGEREAAAS